MEALIIDLEPFANTSAMFQVPGGVVPESVLSPKTPSSPSWSRLTPVGSTLQFALPTPTGRTSFSATGTPYATEQHNLMVPGRRSPLGVFLIAGGAVVLGAGLWFFTQEVSSVPGNVIKAHLGTERAEDAGVNFVRPGEPPTELAPEQDFAAATPSPMPAPSPAVEFVPPPAAEAPPPSAAEAVPPTADDIARTLEQSAERPDRSGRPRAREAVDAGADLERPKYAAKRLSRAGGDKGRAAAASLAQEGDDVVEEQGYRSRRAADKAVGKEDATRLSKPESPRPAARRARSGELSVDEF
jgi:hypothetical protein